MLVRDRIQAILLEALHLAQRQGLLPPGQPPEVVIEHPQSPEHGDYATSFALRLARTLSMNPLEIARRLASCIASDEVIERVWAAPPGFINFTLRAPWLQGQVEEIMARREDYGRPDIGQGEAVLVEFVSVNPTGPIHVGHTRGAVLGSTLARVLEAAGYAVEREYYVNDAGTQMELFYRSLHARYCQALGQEAELPPNGYRGGYLVEVGERLAREHGDQFLRQESQQAVSELGRLGVEMMLEQIREDLALIGVSFDRWFRERSLYREGQYERAMALLREHNHLVQREGATWFASTALGEDKDNVLVRGSGEPTYFASDVAYHYNRFLERDFARAVNIWGADHQGHISRMKAAVGALGVDPDRLTVIITQMVTLKRGGEIVRASKRTGELVTLRELVEEVGADACRYFFLARSPDSQMEFDLELAKAQSAENPVYYIQYAHARIASILRLARERSIDLVTGDVSLLTHEAELALIRQMVRLPELVESMARNLEPHHLPHYASELATAFHWFYQQCRVVSSDPADAELTRARLKLVEAARIVLAQSLHLMGMTTPEQM